MASLNCSELPNPFTSKSFFPSDIAHQIQIADYIYVGTLGALIYDILGNLNNDYKLLSSTRRSIGLAVYFLSRFFTLAYVLGGTLFQTYPLKECYTALEVVGSMYASAVPTTSLLFFLRAMAIFDRNRFLVLFLFCAWLSVLATAITVPIAIKGANIGPLDFCFTASAKNYVTGTGITTLIHDTLIYLLISWRLFQNVYIDRGLACNARAFFSGEYLPAFSRSVLQDGQLYYLITVASNLLNFVVWYIPGLSETYKTMFTVPNLMLTNVMACYVFRNTKLGYHKRIVTTSELRSPGSGSTIVMAKRSRPSQGKRNNPLAAVHVSNITEIAVDAGDSQHDFVVKKVTDLA